MAFVQKVKFSENKVESFSLNNFSGGLNNRSDIIENNQLSDVLNMIYSDDNLLETRNGQEYAQELGLNSAITFMDEYVPYVGDKIFLNATNLNLYANGVLIKTVEGKIHGINHEGRYYFADGKKMYCYGKFPQEDSTYVNVIGTPTTDFIVVEIVSPPVYTPLGTEHEQGVFAIDYTTLKVWYEPCTNEMNDTYKGANVVPNNIKYIVSHKGRLFVSGNKDDDDNTFIGDIRSSFYFPVYLPIQVPPNGDKIVGLIVYDDDVVVGRNKDLFSISGETNRTDAGLEVFNLRKINSHTGFASEDSFDVVNNYLFFLGSDGVPYALDSTRGDYKVIRSTIIGKTIDLTKAPIGWSNHEITHAVSVYHKDYWYLASGDTVLLYSYRNQSWLVHKYIHVSSYYVFNDTLIWGDNFGDIVKYSTGYLDFGTPYLSYFYTKLFNMGDANTYKQFKEAFIVARTYEDYDSNINVKIEIDYADVKDSVTIENNISIWGKSKFGDRFISRLINDSYPIIIGRRGRNIRFKISNRFYIDGEVDYIADLEYYVGRTEGVVVYVVEDTSYYKYTNREWVKLTLNDIEQKMKIYELNGYYEFRGRR